MNIVLRRIWSDETECKDSFHNCDRVLMPDAFPVIMEHLTRQDDHVLNTYLYQCQEPAYRKNKKVYGKRSNAKKAKIKK